MSASIPGEYQLSDYASVLKRRWPWLVLPLLAILGLSYYLSVTQTESFDTSAQVLISDSAAQEAIDGSSQNTAFRDRLLENEIRLARSDQARSAMLELLGEESPVDFSVVADTSSDVLIFSAMGATADEAADIANAAAESYVDLKQLQAEESIVGAVESLELRLEELQAERETVRADLIVLEDRLAIAPEESQDSAQTRVDREASRISGQVTLIDAQIASTANSITELELTRELALGGTARIVSVAVPPLDNSNQPLSLNMLLGLVVGLIVGGSLAFLSESLDNKIRSTRDMENLGLTVLGSVPKASNRTNNKLNLACVSLSEPDSPQAQGHMKAQAAIRFLANQENLTNVLITSASQGEGKTTMASNLAISMARGNVRTVLVDLDLRRPRVHKAYELPQSPGITTVVLERADVADAATLVGELDEHLAIVPAGKLPPHPGSFISSHEFTETVKELAKLSDFTVFDAPPILPVADTLSLAQLVDGVVLVAYANETKNGDLRTALDSMTSSGARILGAVLLGASEDTSSYAYYDTSDELERM